MVRVVTGSGCDGVLSLQPGLPLWVLEEETSPADLMEGWYNHCCPSMAVPAALVLPP